MGRLKLGQTPTPLKERIKVYRHELIDSGGRRILADLGPDGAKALQIVMERDALSIKDAVTAALISYARQAKLL